MNIRPYIISLPAILAIMNPVMTAAQDKTTSTPSRPE